MQVANHSEQSKDTVKDDAQDPITPEKCDVCRGQRTGEASRLMCLGARRIFQIQSYSERCDSLGSCRSLQRFSIYYTECFSAEKKKKKLNAPAFLDGQTSLCLVSLRLRVNLPNSMRN